MDKALFANHRPIDPFNPDPGIMEDTARILVSGGSVVFPTSGLYGLGVDPFNEKAVDRLFRIKERSGEKPILLLIDDPFVLNELVMEIPPAAEKMARAFWPGELTLVFRARDEIPERITSGTGKIGIRFCRHPVAKALVRAAGIPITGTSANISGNPGVSSIENLDERIRGSVDRILDSGPLPGGKSSTILDVTMDPPVILREGAISAGRIFAAL